MRRLTTLVSMLCGVLLTGCPKGKSEEDLGIVRTEAIDLKAHVKKLDPGNKRFDLSVESAKGGVARAFAADSGGALSPVSERVVVPPGKIVKVMTVETYEGDGVAPGGPLYVLGFVDAKQLAFQEKQLAGMTPADLPRAFGDFALTVGWKR